MKKDLWKGFDEEQLTKMPLDQYLKLIDSRSRRTIERLNVNPRLKQFIEEVRSSKKANPKKAIKTHVRDAVILPEWLGLTFMVHNGKEFKRVEISIEKMGHRLGDYSHSTGRVLHSGPGVGATRGSKFVPLK